MTRTKWIIFILACLGILGLVVFWNKNNDTTNFTGDANTVITEGPISDHTLGSSQNKVVLIEYADYQCPGCGDVYGMVNEVVNEYKDQVTYIFRNLPLSNMHPNALAAATAAEAAGLQGKYYEYHDLLYGNQSEWSEASVSKRSSIFEDYAKQLGLDIDRFKSDLSNKDVVAKINRDRSTASKLGIAKTPTMILNGKQLDDSTAFDKAKLKQLLNDAITNAGMTPPSTSTSTATGNTAQ